jgi:hypothetical protein
MFKPGDYTIEKLKNAKDFKIYSPVDASFKFETLNEDLNYDVRGDFDPNYTPEDIMNLF